MERVRCRVPVESRSLGQSTGEMASVELSASLRASGMEAMRVGELDLHFLKTMQERKKIPISSLLVEMASSGVLTLTRQ